MVITTVIFILSLLGIGLIQITESTVSIPFLSFLLGSWFVYARVKWLRVVSLMLLSFLMSVLFLVPASYSLLIWLGLLLFLEFGAGISESSTVRFVLGALLAAGVVAWLANVEWQEGVLAYSLASIVLGTVLVYRSSLRKITRARDVHWSGEQLK